MNKQRRKQLETLADKLYDLQSELEQLKDEEQEYFDNMPESLQGSERGNNSETAIDAMDDIISDLESAVDRIREVAG